MGDENQNKFIYDSNKQQTTNELQQSLVLNSEEPILSVRLY